MHIIRFTQFFQLTNPKTLPFLFLPDANLNPDFQKPMAIAELPKQRRRFMEWLGTHGTTWKWSAMMSQSAAQIT
jgi:hypothetical protein